MPITLFLSFICIKAYSSSLAKVSTSFQNLLMYGQKRKACVMFSSHYNMYNLENLVWQFGKGTSLLQYGFAIS